MTPRALCSSLVLLLAVVAACGGNDPLRPDGNAADAPVVVDAAPPPDAAPVPKLYNPVDMADDALALAALQRLGANVPGADARCGGCHSLTNAHLRQWRNYSSHVWPCLDGADISTPSAAVATVACIKSLSANGQLDARALGVWASAGRLAWFQRLFTEAYGTDSTEYADFIAHTTMPPSADIALNQDQFDVVAEWFVRGVPRLDHYVPPVGPGDCTPGVDHEVDVRVADLKLNGWRAKNLEQGISMYGCGTAASTLDCMSDQPLATARTYSSTWDVAPYSLRLVAELPGYHSAFWTRSSADGRFVAHGGGDGAGGSTIIDLTDDSHIGVDAAYDPGFFPDNSGFVFQGSGRNTCAQSILLGHPASISMGSSPSCAYLGIGLYQHVGRIAGGDYFAISGSFVSDNGGSGEDPWAYFGPTDTAEILPMIFNGTTYVAKTPTSIPVPNEGDAVISPSTRLMMTRRGNAGGKQIAYILHAVDATPNGNSYDVSTPTIGTYCFSGGKPGFSYDERWVVFHHVASPTSDADAIDLGFTGASDPGYAPYASAGTSNIYLLDLTTGDRRRITMMKPGQFAYFPHFRSDGWIYFDEKDSARETIVASDAALRLE